MKVFAIAVAVLALSAATAACGRAETVKLSRTTRPVTAEENAGGAPANGFVHDFFVTSDTDLLCIMEVDVTAPLFQHTMGGDLEPPTQSSVAFAPALSADSFITMPGDTLTLGGAFNGPRGQQLWGDLSNDGAQDGFHFARLTTVGQTGAFSGTVAVRGYSMFEALPFNFTLPGTEAELALLEDEPTFALEYSLDPPPAPVPPPALPEPTPAPALPVVPIVVTPPTPPSIDPPETAPPAEAAVPPAPPESPAPPDLPEVEPPGDILVHGEPDPVDGDQNLGQFVPEIRNGFTPIRIVWSEMVRPSGVVGILHHSSVIDLTTIDWATLRLGAIDGTISSANVRTLTDFIAANDSLPTLTSNGISVRNYADAGQQPSLQHSAFTLQHSEQIPEPSAALLAAVGLLTLSAARRR